MSVTDDRITTEFEVRPLGVRDLRSIMAIENVAFSTPWREATFRSLLARSDTDLVGAIRDGNLVGYAVSWTVGDQAELGNVAVAAEERRRGVARLLVAEILARVGGRGAEEVFLEVRESNRIAQTLYEGCGFRVIGRRRNYYNRPREDALVMRCDLL